MQTLAERLTLARNEKGWSKADLKRHAGLKSPSTLTELESGTAISSPQLPAIAGALGVEALWLQHGKGPKYRSPAAPGPALGPVAIKCAALIDKLPPAEQSRLLHVLGMTSAANDHQSANVSAGRRVVVQMTTPDRRQQNGEDRRRK